MLLTDVERVHTFEFHCHKNIFFAQVYSQIDIKCWHRWGCEVAIRELSLITITLIWVLQRVWEVL